MPMAAFTVTCSEFVEITLKNETIAPNIQNNRPQANFEASNNNDGFFLKIFTNIAEMPSKNKPQQTAIIIP
jgi:hypothetical protein